MHRPDMRIIMSTRFISTPKRVHWLVHAYTRVPTSNIQYPASSILYTIYPTLDTPCTNSSRVQECYTRDKIKVAKTYPIWLAGVQACGIQRDTLWKLMSNAFVFTIMLYLFILHTPVGMCVYNIFIFFWVFVFATARLIVQTITTSLLGVCSSWNYDLRNSLRKKTL